PSTVGRPRSVIEPMIVAHFGAQTGGGGPTHRRSMPGASASGESHVDRSNSARRDRAPKRNPPREKREIRGGQGDWAGFARLEIRGGVSSCAQVTVPSSAQRRDMELIPAGSGQSV